MMSIDPISRRVILTGLLTTGLSASLIKLPIAKANEVTKLLWTGVNFMRGCNECEKLVDAFPNTWPSVNSETGDKAKALLIDELVPKFVDGLTGKNANLEIVIPGPKNAQGKDVKTDYGIFVGISSDRDIAHDYIKSEDKTVQIAELQCYIVIFDIEKYLIIQSYPLRYVAVETIKGRNRDGFIERIQWETLSGKVSSNKTLPKGFAEIAKNLVINRQKPVGIRVTEVKPMGMARKWLSSEKSARGNKIGDYKAILGNALTSAAAEKLNIGMQPFVPTDAILRVTDSMALTEKGEEIRSKDLDFESAPINWDIRLTAFGTKIKDTKIAGSKHFFNRRIDIFVGISVGKYERTFSDGAIPIEIIEEQKLVKEVFRQNFHAVSIEESTGAWTNNWYYSLDLHTRLFEWFFYNLKKERYGLIFNGEQKNHKTRRFLTKAHAKDFDQFKIQAKALRQILLG
ncbi:MAG: hypothetical protein CL885_01760 [Dehalococcoidia bacterium]|nr:hypothetical protein [Dehalococcoidia bacterium]